MARKRDYDKEYREYHGTPEQKENRAARGRARYAMEKEVGKSALAGKDVDHKRPIRNGGSNSRSNLRVASVKENRGWRRGK
jgi:5-methylcytosine-specific restriction endonuclease McrA